MEPFDLQGQVLYKQLSRVDCHSCCEGNLATQSLLCIVFCLHPHYFQLRHRRHSLKSHRSPLHPVCQQTSQRTDNSLPASECLLLLLFRLLLLLLLPRRAYQRLQCRRTKRRGRWGLLSELNHAHLAIKQALSILQKNFLGDETGSLPLTIKECTKRMIKVPSSSENYFTREQSTIRCEISRR